MSCALKHEHNLSYQVCGDPVRTPQVLAIVYVGVTVSDMVTFYLGAALRRGLFKSMKQRLFK